MSQRIGISTADLQRLLDIVDPARCGEPGDELPYSTLQDLADLVPCDQITFNRGDYRQRRFSWQSSTDTGDAGEFEELFWACVASTVDTGYRGPEVRTYESRWQDLRGHPQQAKAAFEYAAMQSEGVRVYLEVTVNFPSEGTAGCDLSLARTSGPAFSEREVMLLTLLRPHLIALHVRHRRLRSGVPDVTPRQREILSLVAAGHTNRQIARALDLSEGTVRKHLENTYDRLGVSNRTEALAKASSAWPETTYASA